jgi:hypothetical protein
MLTRQRIVKIPLSLRRFGKTDTDTDAGAYANARASTPRRTTGRAAHSNLTHTAYLRRQTIDAQNRAALCDILISAEELKRQRNDDCQQDYADLLHEGAILHHGAFRSPCAIKPLQFKVS